MQRARLTSPRCGATRETDTDGDGTAPPEAAAAAARRGGSGRRRGLLGYKHQVLQPRMQSTNPESTVIPSQTSTNNYLSRRVPAGCRTSDQLAKGCGRRRWGKMQVLCRQTISQKVQRNKDKVTKKRNTKNSNSSTDKVTRLKEYFPLTTFQHKRTWRKDYHEPNP